MKQLLPLILSLIILSGCDNSSNDTEDIPSDNAAATPTIAYTVANMHPHDTALFTEGLLFHNGQLFESTGSPKDIPGAKSRVGITDLKTGKFSSKIEIDKDKYFGEGIVFFKDKLYQLTYKNQLCFIYDANTFKEVGQFKYASLEGWSLTTDGTSLIMSDGTDGLTYFDPEKLTPVKTLKITDQGQPIEFLNELEYIKGFIYANIWTKNFIVKIDPSNGKVVGKLDLTALMAEAQQKNPGVDVLNGIAYDAATDKIYVTGKMWANIYELSFAH